MSYALIHEIKTSARVIYVPRDEILRNHNQSDVAADENLATLEFLPATISTFLHFIINRALNACRLEIVFVLK